MSDISTIFINRLLKIYNPWYPLDLDHEIDFSKIRLVRNYREIRSKSYSLGRIKYLIRKIKTDCWVPDAIEIDNIWSGGCPCGVIIIDGHHRVIAAFLAGLKTIECTYSGDLDILNWMTGRVSKIPSILGF